MIPTSATLLERLRDRGDAAAWERLVRLYSPLIRGWSTRHLPQSADVDDLAQQVFLVVVEKLPAFEHNGRTGAFRAWLRGISVNRLRMFWRSRPEGGGPDPEPLLQQLEDPHSDLSRQWDREHDQHVARQMLALLEPEFKPTTWRAFCLLVLDGWEPERVAAEVGLSVNAVFITKSRVLRRLREEMTGLVL
jgi:RNA polymerase sigma-70 factor (ECF subfamily)